MKPLGLIFLFAGILMMCSGAYIVFGKGDSMGTVFLGTGSTFAALSVVFGVIAKKQDEEKGE